MNGDGGVDDSSGSHTDEVPSETLSGPRSSQRCLRSGLRVIDMVWVLVVLVVTSDGTGADVE